MLAGMAFLLAWQYIATSQFTSDENGIKILFVGVMSSLLGHTM